MHWHYTEMALLDAARAVVWFAANWLLQSTLLIAAGLAIAWLLRRRGSALQSAIYRTTLAAVIVCPLATALLSCGGVSGWSVELPVAWTYEEETPLLVHDGALESLSSPFPTAAENSPRPEPGSLATRPRPNTPAFGSEPLPERFPNTQASSGLGGQLPAGNTPVMVSTRSNGVTSTQTFRVKTARFEVRAFGLAAILLSLAWLDASAVLLWRLARAWRRLGQLRRAAAVAEPAAQQACRQLSALLAVAVPEVRRTPYLASPCLAGLLCPAVLLPEADASLPLRDVLIHELAHLRRRDSWWNLLTRLTEALFFYQPLLWMLARRLESAAEEVCDDHVVQLGGDREQYARGLLEIAELSSPPVGAAGVAMVSLRSILARRVTRIVDPSRSLSTRAGNLLLAIVIVGGLTGTLIVGFVGLAQHPSANAEPIATTAAKEPAAGNGNQKQNASEPVAKTKAESTDDVAKPGHPLAGAAGSSDIDDLVTVTGKVVTPDGKPIAGAKLYAVRWYWEPHIPHPPLAETASDADGRFTISYRKSQFYIDLGRLNQWEETSIVATADGFGAGWVTWRDIPRGEEATLRLVTDDAPIVGRVVDLEGKPVAGVAVRVGAIHTGKGGNFDAWLAAVGRGEFAWTAAKHLEDSLPQFDGWPPPVVTDNDGRFHVNGIGRERGTRLSFSGPSNAYQEVEAVTRRSGKFPLKFSRSEKEFDPVYGADFELVAAPTQPIMGIVRDAETRQPLAGVSIESNKFAGSSFVNTRQLRAVSDEQGRYRLVGMPKGAGNRILAVPNDDQPYLMRDIDVPESRGLGPVDVDIELHRGIWITGRVTDLRTGEPLSARLHYLPFRSNDYAQKTPEFGETLSADSWGFQNRYVSRPDGTYRLVGLPGRAIVGAECVLGHYRKGAGAEHIAGMDEHGHFDTYCNPVMAGKKWPSAMKEINPSPGAKEIICDLALDPGEAVKVDVLDPDGKPVDSFETQGSGQSWSDSPDLRGSFDVITLGPEEIRTVVIRQKERKLGKVIRVSLANHPSRSLSVALEPTGRIVGRLLDRQGTPISGAAVEALLKPTGDFSQRLPPTATDEQGRFEYTEIPTGCHYVLTAEAVGMARGGRSFAKDVAIMPGETKDLGDVVYGAAQPAETDQSADAGAAKTSTATKAANEKTVRGRVTRGGRAASGAHVAVIARRTSVQRGGELGWGDEVLAEATANENGEYSMTLADASQKTHADATLVARQEGAAIAWRRVNLDAAETEAALELPDEVPVRGKAIDVEGRPAAGVRISVVSVVVRTDHVHEAQGVGYHGGDKLPAAWLATVTSDAQGRFVLHGLAANHGVSLEVAGDDRFAEQDILLNTGAQEQRGDHDRTYRSLVKNVQPGEEAGLVLAPAQPFEGTVRYADTGQGVPHARVTIWASQEKYGSMMSVAGRADEQGHYRISPRPGIRFGVTAYPPEGAAYLARDTPLDKAFEWKAVERSKQVDMTLPRGVLVRGMVVEAGSETPVVGAAVQYLPESSNNPNASDDILTGWQAIQLTDLDGRFSMAVLPGPGHLLVNSQQAGYILQEIGGRQLGQGKPGGMRNYAHAIAKLDPQAGQEALDVKLELKRGETVTGRIVDEAGKLVDEALVISRLNISPYSLSWRGHTTPTLGGAFELAGLAQGVEYPVYFLDAKRRLGATEIIKAGDGERTVVLKPCGEAMLRLVDGKGQPVPAQYVSDEMVVTPGVSRFDRDAVERGELMADSDFIANIDRINHPLASADDESGKLSLRALIPGATYRLSAQRGGKPQIVKEFHVRANETLDLGEIVVERE